MARGRFISNSISASKKFARLKNDTHRLMYLILITHADAEGRHDADPRVLKGKVYTLLDLSDDTLERGLADMNGVGLVSVYEVRGERYVEVTDFHKHNKIRRDANGDPTHESKSECPAKPRSTSDGVTTESLRSNYGVATAEVEVEVEVEVQGQVQVQQHLRPALDIAADDAAVAADLEYLTRQNASRAARTHAHHVLMHDHPDVWRTLGELGGMFEWKHPQVRRIAEKVLELVRTHGAPKVLAVCDKVILNASNIRNPIAFLDKVLSEDERATTAGTTSPLDNEAALERIFGAN
jgi:hypothetical protein